MTELQALFFDFDGVIADSVEVKTKAFSKLFLEYGHDIQNKVVEHHRNHGGMSRFDKFRYYYKEFLGESLNEQKLDNICNRFSDIVVDEVVNSPEIPGSKDFLKKCSSQYPCFIISATPEDEIRMIAKRRDVDEHFIEILGSPTSKKKNIELILSKYKYVPGKCLFFGDAESDYAAAMEWNVQFIGILPDHNAPLLKAAPNIRWFKDFTAITIDDI